MPEISPLLRRAANLKRLWCAFSLVWAIHLLYVVSVGRREKKLRDELEALKSMVQERK